MVWTPPRTPSWWGGAVSGFKDEMRRLEMQLQLKFGVGGRAEGARDVVRKGLWKQDPG